MTCDERKDLILLYAADALDEAEQQELRTHLRGGCATCTQVLAEAEDTMSRLPEGLTPVEPPPAALNRLMRQVTADHARGSSSGAGWRIGAIAASIGIIVGALAIHSYESNRHEKALNNVLAQVADRDAKLGEVKSMLASEKLKFVGLAQEQSPAFGRVIWDQDRSKWHLFVFELKPLPPDKTYELWFIKADKTPVAAGLFVTDQNGRATVTVEVPTNLGPLAAAGVSEEPQGGSPQPTQIRLLGAIQ
jgi:anti-sigma-K factor RskA